MSALSWEGDDIEVEEGVAPPLFAPVLTAAFDPSKHPHKPRGAGGGQWARAAEVAAEAATDGVVMDVTETDEVLKLNRIVSEHQGEGNASEALDELVEYADEHGKPVFLNPSSLGGLTQEELVAWYRRHGFAPVGKGMVHDRDAAVVAAIAPFLVAAAWDPSEHPRNPKGTKGGGRFRTLAEVLDNPDERMALVDEGEHEQLTRLSKEARAKAANALKKRKATQDPQETAFQSMRHTGMLEEARSLEEAAKVAKIQARINSGN